MAELRFFFRRVSAKASRLPSAGLPPVGVADGYPCEE